MALRTAKRPAKRKKAAAKSGAPVPVKKEALAPAPTRPHLASFFGDPFREIARLRREMDRLLESGPFAALGRRFPSFMDETPTLDVYQEGDDVVVKAEVPGMEKKDLDVSVEGDMLTVRGEKKKEEDVQEGDYTFRERSYGSFRRRVRLPTDIDTVKAKATFKNGVLTIRLPTSEAAKQRTRKVKVD